MQCSFAVVYGGAGECFLEGLNHANRQCNRTEGSRALIIPEEVIAKSGAASH